MANLVNLCRRIDVGLAKSHVAKKKATVTDGSVTMLIVLEVI